MDNFDKPKTVSDVSMAFGGIDGLMPELKDIPEEFERDSNPWVKWQSDWFSDYHAVALELDRLMLVIESAVRWQDPTNHAAVLAMLKANRAAIAKATQEPPHA